MVESKDNKNVKFKFISKKQAKLLEHIGSAIIGVPFEDLGEGYIQEIDDFLSTLPKWVQKDFKLLFFSFNLIFLRLFFTFKVTSFTKMNTKQKINYMKKWGNSRIPLMRSGIVGLKGVVSWGYYSQNEAFLKEINYPGSTIGREDITPTHLFGKKPWKQTNAQ
jgi:hypothetical protein